MIQLTTQVTQSQLSSLNSGDQVLLSGIIYTARDAAHKRFEQAFLEKKELPVDLRGQILYYTGPSPAPPGKIIGSAGPTTSSRMDTYTPELLASTGLAAMIGKGNRSPAVIEAMVKSGCVYFAAVGGAGALLSKHIIASEIICYEDLGAEAVHKLTVKDFPLIVAIDSKGVNLYQKGPEEYRKNLSIKGI
ncbi:MAG: Fe-S-containing hydro-lyase [Chitinispirillaceae bacterium]|nr:Fe-S-containing hydro-lyase [Chitinispirillaceae bacterium]